MAKIYLGSVVWRQRDESFCQAIEKLKELIRQSDWTLIDGVVVGDALVSRSRSIAASKFLRSDADVLLSIDSDIIFDPAQVLGFCQRAIESKAILGGAYYGHDFKKPQPTWLCCPDQDILFAPGMQCDLAEVRYVGGGFMAIDRSVIERLSETLPFCHKTFEGGGFWPFYQPCTVADHKDVNLYLSEDWAISEYASKLGIKTYLDPSILLGHMTLKPLTMMEFFNKSLDVNTPYLMHYDACGEVTIKVPQPKEQGVN